MNGRIKILIITDVFKIVAGSERNIIHLLNHIDPNNFELIAASFISGKIGQDMRKKGFTVFQLNRGGIYTYNGIRNILYLYKLIREKKISLILTYHESSDFFGLLLSRLCHVPVISNRRDMGFKTRWHHKIAYKIFGKLFSAVITVSDAVREEMIKHNWFHPDRIFTIYNGIDTEEYKGADKKEKIKEVIGIEDGHSVVGLIANLRKIKGIKYFIEAASIVKKTDSRVKFLIIGADMNESGCTKDELELFAKKCNVDKEVHFLGKRTDIPDIISIMDIGVVSSLSEGFSNAILEYMAASKPVVATDVGGNREAVIHGETGLLVSPKNAIALAEAILSIVKDKEMAFQYGTAGKKRIEENFKLRMMIRKYEELFEKVNIEPKYHPILRSFLAPERDLKKRCIGFLFFYGGGFHLFRFIHNLLGRRLTIVTYHRITDRDINTIESSLPFLFTTQPVFEKQLQFFKRWYRIITFEDLETYLKKGIIPWNLLIISFDDGYEDIYSKAYPILRKMSLPAIVFLTTEMIGNSHRAIFWWDKTYHHLRRKLTSFEAGMEGKEDTRLRHLLENFRKSPSKLFAHLNNASEGEREEMLNLVNSETGVGEIDLRKANAMLDWHQIQTMSDHIQFGSHTCTHKNLLRLNGKERHYEIDHSKKMIEKNVGKVVIVFSYPYGNMDSESRQKLIESGYRFAVNANAGMNNLKDPFALKRINIWEDTSLSLGRNFSKGFLAYKLLVAIFSGRRAYRTEWVGG